MTGQTSSASARPARSYVANEARVARRMAPATVPMRRRLSLATVLLAVAFAAVAAAPAAAAPGFGRYDAAAYDRQLEATLGAGYGGMWVDGSTRRVAVTDAALADDARAQGARPQLVAHSLRELEGVSSQLHRAAATRPAHVAGWGVDVRRNAVVISVVGKDARAMAFARRWQARSDAVRIEHVAEAPRPYWDIIGGQAIFTGGSRCSAGFNARGGATRYVITAGHCTNVGSAWTGVGGSLGTTAGSSFPGNDYGIIRVTSASALSTPYVDRYSAGSDVRVAGVGTAVIGQPVCRSGSTTGWRCGLVLATNQTVCYPQGCVTQMIRTTACAQPGDSGGPLVNNPLLGTTVVALGLTSGGSGNCLLGGTTFFQPINEVLSRYGLYPVT
jgi:streptogrisin C